MTLQNMHIYIIRIPEGKEKRVKIGQEYLRK